LPNKNSGKVLIYTLNKTSPLYFTAMAQAALTSYRNRSHCINNLQTYWAIIYGRDSRPCPFWGHM